VLGCNNYDVVDLGVMVPCQKILDAAKAEKADVIGLSGLITPSLEEMTNVAKEMERQGFRVPLLIGGATTSIAHTAVKIEPNYSEPVVYVLDASRSVGVMGSLLSEDLRAPFVEKTRAEYAVIRERHKGKTAAVRYVPYEEARSNGVVIDWNAERPAAPKHPGVTVFEDYPLGELVERIDWTPFFATWQLKGRYPEILSAPNVGPEATKLFNDAKAMLARIVKDKSLRAKGVVGLWPANRVGDDIELYADESRKDVLEIIHCLRQQMEKPPGRPNHSLADFVAPKETGVPDYVGAFAVTTGLGLDAIVEHYQRDHDDYHAILAKALADRLAEAFAERLHERVRRELWGYAADEGLTNEDLIGEKYRGIRPAPGYPACPDHTEKRTIFALLKAEANASMQLTESCAMWPAASVSGLYFSHPKSQYFGLGKIQKDQVEDYARRKGMSVEDVERWLAPNLAYDR
ncbi:MAG: cobalamin-dependent protein, partial [Myxococcales bacterium]|nr:cobalamin-dependent protein [Myxococcales bacterium]